MRACDIENYIREKFDISTKPSQIYYWEDKGLLGKITRGKKNRRNFTESDLQTILIILMLTEINTPLRSIKKIVLDKDPKTMGVAAEKLLQLQDNIIPALQKYLASNKTRAAISK